MSDPVQQISRALENGDFHCALSFMGVGHNSSFRFSSRGPPEIPAFSPKKPRSGNIPPSRPKIYGPPPFPAFQRRNSQNTPREEHESLKDPGMFLNFSRMIPSAEMTSYPVLDPSGFFPTILISSRTSSMFLPSEDMSKEDEDEPIASGDEETPTLSEDDLCPFCARTKDDNNNDKPPTETKQLVFEVLKAVNSDSSESSRFTDFSPKEVYSALDVRPAAMLSSSPQQSGDVTAAPTPEEKHLCVMFSTDTFHDSSASSTQELCLVFRDEEQESTTYIDTGLPTCGPMSDTVLPPSSRLMTLS